MNVVNIPVSEMKPRRADGEGSVQVQLDPNLKIGKAKVFAVMARAELVRAPPPQISR